MFCECFAKRARARRRDQKSERSPRWCGSTVPNWVVSREELPRFLKSRSRYDRTARSPRCRSRSSTHRPLFSPVAEGDGTAGTARSRSPGDLSMMRGAVAGDSPPAESRSDSAEVEEGRRSAWRISEAGEARRRAETAGKSRGRAENSSTMHLGSLAEATRCGRVSKSSLEAA